MNVCINVAMNNHKNVHLLHLNLPVKFHMNVLLKKFHLVYLNVHINVHMNIHMNDHIIVTTGCFRVNEIMFLLISQPLKHLNRLDRSYIFTEFIAF